MFPRTIVCPDCGEAVPSGRSSCPACGVPLASMATTARPADAVVDAATADHAPSEDPSVLAPARIQTRALPDPAPGDAPDPGTTPSEDLGPATPLTPSSIHQMGIVGSAPMATVPGGYLPPGTAVPIATLPSPAPVAPSAQAAPTVPSLASAPDATTNEPADVPTTWYPARLDQPLGYATAVGSGLIVFGMLMPWSRIVIGAGGASGYFDTWGLAGPAHILVLLSAMVVLAISTLPNRIPVSVRSGVAGLVLGALSLGLVWPYLIGPLGAGIGVLVVTAGALVLTATGIASAWRDRHSADERSV